MCVCVCVCVCVSALMRIPSVSAAHLLSKALLHFEDCSLLQLFAKETPIDLTRRSLPDARRKKNGLVFADFLPRIVSFFICKTVVYFAAAVLTSIPGQGNYTELRTVYLRRNANN